MVRPCVHVYAARQILFPQKNIIQCSRPSPGNLPSHVRVQARRRGRRRHPDGNQQRVRIFEIIVKSHTNPVVQNRQIDTDVFIHGSLPFQVFIPVLLNQRTRPKHILQFHVVHVSLLRYVSIEVFVSRITD